jgi:hypothetical protein
MIRCKIMNKKARIRVFTSRGASDISIWLDPNHISLHLRADYSDILMFLRKMGLFS